MMLVEFTVGNYRSFKNPVTLSMVASRLSERDPQVNLENTFEVNKDLTLLTNAGIYGANASGKSNLVRALGFMRDFVLNSSKETQVDDQINIAPFRLDALSESEPSYFEIIFFLDGVLYRYGFEASTRKIETEWLFFSPHGKEAKLFIRDGNKFSIGRSYKGVKPAIPLTRQNSLFLSVNAQFNNELAIKVLSWFRSMNVISGLEDIRYAGATAAMFAQNEKYRNKIINLIINSDVGINKLDVELISIQDPRAIPKDLPQDVKEFIISKLMKEGGNMITFRTSHNKQCENGLIEEVFFDLDDESEGTQKLFHISGPVIDTLSNGQILVVDEMEARLHTILTRNLIGLFNSRETNPHHAQLIFATHDTNLMSKDFLRRDQIWFIEKDEFGASHLYSLAELKIRNERNYENDYLNGRYGGVPVLGEMRKLFKELGEDDAQK